ncbi:exonuclease V, chloroplastic [Olea europaea subsp. europaea]|uniref:Exonuclease V, chloroplastic n=1 Tax=Olea europaea subsp. europaea TaxID=158383 RepID=A0A8S0TRM6_OLEEU|nr:exonuclease V, chloroplastic [Olea europaea subsp. europaea]
MTKSPTRSPPFSTTTATKVPQEIISEEEMALIDSAFASAAAQFPRNQRSIQSITRLSKRTLLDSMATGSSPDIEDSGRVGWSDSSPLKKRNRGLDSFLHRFRRKRGLSVTDITATEWCEKQMEFCLLFGKPEKTKAMKAGSVRHVELEEEVIKRVKIHVSSNEDVWALKFVNFIIGANQLIFDGLTRELPIVGFAEGIWMVGVIDEIRISESERYATLVDTKTRVQAKFPTEPQQRNGRYNQWLVDYFFKLLKLVDFFLAVLVTHMFKIYLGRLQLMCYKRLWDSLVVDKFPVQKFFDFFSLNPHCILSAEIRENTAKSGFASETLNDLVRYFRNSCFQLPRAHGLLTLRYELQADQSLIGEDEFAYDCEWVKGQIKSSLEFWVGERKASYTPTEERWKCRFCKFANVCPGNSNPNASSTPS